MTVSYVERDQANPETLAFYDKAEARFEMLLNIFKVSVTHRSSAPCSPIWSWRS